MTKTSKRTRYDIPPFPPERKKQTITEKTISNVNKLCNVILIIITITLLPFVILLYLFLDIGRKNEKNDRK